MARRVGHRRSHQVILLAQVSCITIGLARDHLTLNSYINGATSPGVTLQGTLMNHTQTMQSVNAHVVEYNTIVANSNTSVPPHIFGETNSLYNEGKPGLSNSFGAALWGVDFNLYCASVGIRRVHMHMGTDYRVGQRSCPSSRNTF